MPKNKHTITMLGIDPGSSRIGYSVITDTPHMTVKAAGSIEIKPGEAPEKLRELKRHLAHVIKKYRPNALSVETLFFSKNKKTALAVAEARGVILLTAAEYNLPVSEFSPTSIKKIIGGHGASDKRALARFAERLLNIKLPSSPDDISDAVAIALAGILSTPFNTRTSNPRM